MSATTQEQSTLVPNNERGEASVNKVLTSLQLQWSRGVEPKFCEAQARVRQGSARDGSQGKRP